RPRWTRGFRNCSPASRRRRMSRSGCRRRLLRDRRSRSMVESCRVAAQRTDAVAATRRRWLSRNSDGVLGAAFVIPSVALFLLFTVFPLYRTVRLSFTSWDGVSPHAQSVGLHNYATALHDHLWWVSIE